MFFRSTIRPALSGFMLLLFALSVTPKKILHDWVANHRDTPGKFSHSADPKLQRSGYNCHIEDLVVESPFTEAGQPVQIAAAPAFYLHFGVVSKDLHSVSPLFSELRGPPAHL